MKLWSAIAVLVAVTLAQAACDVGGAALVAVVQLETGVQATCVSVTVTEPGTSRQLGEGHAERTPGQDQYRIAVYRKGPDGTLLPDEVVLQAHALAGPDGCAAGAAEVSTSEAVQKRFPAGSSDQVPLFVPRAVVGPDALHLQAVGPVLNAGDCVNTAVRATRDGVPAVVAADTAVDLSVQPATGLSFFTDGTCTALPVTQATLAAGSSVLPVQLAGVAAGTYVASASATGMDAGSLSVDVVLTQARSIAFGSPAVTALAGGCLGPVRLQARDALGAPTVVSFNANIGLSAPAGVMFYPDGACAGATASVVLGAGQPETQFWFRSRAIGQVTLRAAAAALGNATQTEQIVPNVRTGSCGMSDGTLSIACTIPMPGVFDLSRAFVVIQAISNDDNPNGVNVRCRLTDATTITCSRAGITGWVDVAWQLVELPTGLFVQRVDNSVCTGNVITLPQAVDPAKTFLLFTAEGSGLTVDANDYRTVSLVSPTQVEVLNNTDCGNAILDVQVVQWEGAVVDRGVLDAGFVPSVSVTTGTPADLGRSFLLHSARFTGGSPLCGFQIRGQLTTDTSIDFTRGDGDTVNCPTPDITAISWERVQLPTGATAQQKVISMADGESTATATLSPVDPARSFAFASSNFNAGQGFGETTYNADDQPGAVGAKLSLATGSRLQADRAVDGGSSKWTSYVVELP
ncbi:MAG TPA: hypothetical protein VFA20_33485 [Myxococcaceae bacterium]|nr:hypothetical protein [Myxococcaceae bacterium]